MAMDLECVGWAKVRSSRAVPMRKAAAQRRHARKTPRFAHPTQCRTRPNANLVSFGIAALLLTCASAAFAQDAPAGDAGKGKALYMTDGCYSCHGTAGQGGGGRTGGLRVAQIALPFAAFLNQLRHPANEMPPYVEAVLSDRDATDIFAFIASLPPPPDVKTIPQLNDIK